MKINILKYFLSGLIIFISNSEIFAQKNEFLQAKIDFNNKNYTSASAQIDDYLAQNKSNQDALFLSGKIYLELKQYHKSIENLLTLSYKKYPELNLLLARAYSGLNDDKNALLYLSKYMKQRNKLPADKIVAFPEFGNISDRLSWQNLWEKNAYSKKELLFIDAKEAFDNKDYEKAEYLLNQYILKYDARADVLYMKSVIATEQANYKDALNYLEKAIDLSDDLRYLKAKAEVEYRFKKYTKALKTYNLALLKDSLDLDIYWGRSVVYSALNNYEQARADIQKYLLYYPESEPALKRYAQIAYNGKDYLTAIRTYSKLIEKFPANASYLKLRADAYMATQTYQYAIKDYSMALDLYPRDAAIYYQKGMAHFKLRQMDKACNAWKNAEKYGNTDSKRLIYRYCK